MQLIISIKPKILSITDKILTISISLIRLLRHMQKPTKVIANKAIGSKFDLGELVLVEKDTQLYALSVGFNMDPLKQEDFKYTSQWNSDFTTFPTITSVMKLTGAIYMLMNSPYIPSYQIHQLLHAEQKLYMLHRKIKTGMTYRMENQMIDVIDKGKNAFFIIRQTAYLKDGNGGEDKAFYIDRNLFVRGLGGFGFKGNKVSVVIPNHPTRDPDYVFKDTTFPSQAFFFRLCNDANPLHIDPSIAAMAGFQRPIIHGMATYGIVARNLVQNLLQNDPEALRSYEVKLIGHVFPGQSLEIKVWKEGNRLLFLVQVIERKTKALTGVLTVRENPKL